MLPRKSFRQEKSKLFDVPATECRIRRRVKAREAGVN
jgi:hypothetical protein